MTEWTVRIKNSTKPDLRKLKQSHLDRRFLDVVETLKTNPYAPTDSFEKLHPAIAGRYSRRLTRQHRIVYTIDDETHDVTIYSAWTHYE